MAFKRQELREILGEAYTDDIGTKLVNLHRGVIDPLRDELDTAKNDVARYKTEADKVPDLEKRLKDFEGGEDYKKKYEDEHTAFENYKKQVLQDAQTAKVKAAYRKLLTEEKVSEKALDSILNVTDFGSMKLKDDGTLDGIEELKKTITEKWSGFVVNTGRRGKSAETPPPGGNNDDDSDDIRELTRQWHEARFGAAPKT